MALKRNNQNNTAATEDAASTAAAAAMLNAETTPPWEAEEDVAVAVAPPAAQPAAQPTAQQAAAQAHAATSTAIATSAASIAADKARKFREELAEMEGAASFDYGTLPIYKASNGGISETGNGRGTFGRWVSGRMLAYSKFWQVSPGGSDTKLKGFVGFSNDGQTMDHIIGDGTERSFVGRPIQDYVEHLRTTEGLDKAESKEYLNVAFLVVESEKGSVEAGSIVNVVLSQSSIRSFTAYSEQLKLQARAAAMGLPVKGGMPEDPFRFRFVAEEAQNNGNRWTKLVIEAA